jgi:hypothetical protein
VTLKTQQISAQITYSLEETSPIKEAFEVNFPHFCPSQVLCKVKYYCYQAADRETWADKH